MFTAFRQLQGTVGITCGEQLNGELGISQATDGIEARGQAKAHPLAIDGAILQTGEFRQGPQPRQGRTVQLRQTLLQPAAIDASERRHVSDGANAEQIQGCAQRLGIAQPLRHRSRQDVGQPHTRQTAIGGTGRCEGGMQQSQQRWTLGRNGVVVGNDHLQPQSLSALQGFAGADAVVDSDQQLDALLSQPLHHGGIEAIALALAAGNGRLGLGPQTTQHPHQQSGAGHAIGVVITAHRQGLAFTAGLQQALHRTLQIGEVGLGLRGWIGLQQALQLLLALNPTALQHRHQSRWQRG